MAEEDIDLDIYGDSNDDYQHNLPEKTESSSDRVKDEIGKVESDASIKMELQPQPELETYEDTKMEMGHETDGQEKISTTDDSSQAQPDIPKQPPQKQGIKRKEGHDDRIVEPGATSALFISDLHWWTTDDDIRGWVNQCECEDELKDVTFSEHKVNGKSKGQAFLEFTSPQAATAVKAKVESFGTGATSSKKVTVSYTSAAINPFRTLPKDAPPKNNGQRDPRSQMGGFSHSSGINNSLNNFTPNSSSAGGFRGRGSGYVNNRGLANGNYPNRNFPSPMANPPNNNFQQVPQMGFPPMHHNAPMPQFNYQPNRGAMMGGMRGVMGMRGRGAMPPNGMMGNMPVNNTMSGIPMGGMAGIGGNMMVGQMTGLQGMEGFPNTWGQFGNSPNL
ncbi:MAG: hypothetical protein M1829_001114, partial [Trizodia sp. TS-e1964]